MFIKFIYPLPPTPLLSVLYVFWDYTFKPTTIDIEGGMECEGVETAELVLIAYVFFNNVTFEGKF